MARLARTTILVAARLARTAVLVAARLLLLLLLLLYTFGTKCDVMEAEEEVEETKLVMSPGVVVNQVSEVVDAEEVKGKSPFYFN